MKRRLPYLSAAFAALLLCTAGASAQEKPAEEKKEEAAAAAPAAAEGPSATESLVKGSVEVGYRAVGAVRGDLNTYRSVVNLGEGVRVMSVDLTMSPSLKWIDDVALRMNNWGGDPYNSAWFRAGRKNWYRLTVDYRNIAYFNALPSFANPNLERGLLQSERTFDMSRRYSNSELEITPWVHYRPYLGFETSSGSGRGVTTYVPSLNNYPVPNDLRDGQRTFREGVRIQYSRFHLTAEAGQFRFKDDQRVYENSPGNLGDRTTPLNGQTLLLRTLQQSYGIRGEATYWRGTLTANPFSWLDFFGNYLYTTPKIDTNYFEAATGVFAENAVLPIFTRQQQLWTAISKQPHNRAHFGFEVRPFSRLRIIQSLYTDRLHTASGGQGTLTGSGTTVLGAADRLTANYSQSQVEALLDVTSKITLRGGYRYTWGDTALRAPTLASFTGPEIGSLARKTALGGVSYRAMQGIWASFDLEIAKSDRVYYRTSLYDYQKYRGRLRWQLRPDLSVAWGLSYLNNDTPNSNTLPLGLGDYTLRTIDHNISMVWNPKGGDRFRVTGEYARQNWKSQIRYISLPFGIRELSRYREDVHAGSFIGDFVPATGKNHAPRFSLGGSYFRSSGTRPAMYLQPLIRTSFPLHKRVEFIAEWRYWGFTQALYTGEAFRNNQTTISLRFWQ
ncbi:MAG: hypothetical protein SGI92_26070 [Bryobacteraceae bacterium]|nr:hypothetical protein [Bryobacteraceae bacterium]